MKTIRQLIRMTKAIITLCVCGLAFAGAAYMQGMIEPVIERVKVPVEVPVEKPLPTLRELIETVPAAYGISPILAAAIVERESNGRKDAIRFESSQLARASKITKDFEQQRMYASSHCAFQVMGWHMPRFNLSWSDLYNPQTCAEVAMTILKDCMDRHKGKSKMQQIRGALACYNGSEKYADAVIARLGEVLIESNL